MMHMLLEQQVPSKQQQVTMTVVLPCLETIPLLPPSDSMKGTELVLKMIYMQCSEHMAATGVAVAAEGTVEVERTTVVTHRTAVVVEDVEGA